MDKEKNLEDFEFIYNEVVRYLNSFYIEKDHKAVSEFIKNEPDLSMIYKMPSNVRSDGEFIIGKEAYLRFYEIAKRIRKPSKINEIKNLSLDVITKSLMLKFENAILVKQEELNKETVCKIISHALNGIEKNQENMTHYIPSVFFSDFKDETELFPGLTIVNIGTFSKYCEKELNKNNYKKDDLLLGYKTHLDKFNSVFCIKIDNCSEKISKERAKKALNFFIGIIQIYAGRNNSYKIRSSDSISNIKTYQAFSNDTKLDLSENINFGGGFVEGWQDFINPEKNATAKIFRVVFREILNPQKHDALSNRIVDAVLWFNEAIYENNIYSRIVKYTTAIECLTNTDEEKTSQTIEDRVSKLLSFFEEDREHWREKISKVYSQRSCIVHGKISISETHNYISDHDAEEIAKRVIMASCVCFHDIGLESHMTSRGLRKKYAQIENVEPLIKNQERT